VVNLVASILHFGDNILNFHDYPEPTWIPSPHVVDALWFVITPILFLGWWFSLRNAKWTAISLFWSLRINLLICGEALAPHPHRARASSSRAKRLDDTGAQLNGCTGRKPLLYCAPRVTVPARGSRR